MPFTHKRTKGFRKDKTIQETVPSAESKLSDQAQEAEHLNVALQDLIALILSVSGPLWWNQKKIPLAPRILQYATKLQQVTNNTIRQKGKCKEWKIGTSEYIPASLISLYINKNLKNKINAVIHKYPRRHCGKTCMAQ